MGTDPILSAASTLDIGPGVKAQDLHRDDFIWQQKHETKRDEYRIGEDVGMGVLVAGVSTRKENGATLVSNARVSASFVSLPPFSPPSSSTYVRDSMYKCTMYPRNLERPELLTELVVCARISSMGRFEASEVGGSHGSRVGGGGSILISGISCTCGGCKYNRA